MPASGEFRLSITRALTDQLITSLQDLEPEPLTEPAPRALEDKPGIYQLYLEGELVYVGKADRSLPSRLSRHHRKLAGRANINLQDICYCVLYVYEDLQAVAPETLLINYYRQQHVAPWNFNGFGSNDPGRNRDQTVYESDHFDVQHPARLDWQCEDIAAGSYTAQELAKQLKTDLPYLFRFQQSAMLSQVTVQVPNSGMIADELLQLLSDAVRERDQAWRVVALPGYVIMYARPGDYPSARKIY